MEIFVVLKSKLQEHFEEFVRRGEGIDEKIIDVTFIRNGLLIIVTSIEHEHPQKIYLLLMSGILFDYLEEARKLINFTRKVCELDKDGKTWDNEAQRAYESTEGSKSQSHPTISISLDPFKSKRLSENSEKTVNREANPKSTTRPKVPPKRKEDEKAGNEIFRNSDFVKLSDSEDELPLPSRDDQSEPTNTQSISALQKNFDTATAADAGLQKQAPEHTKLPQNREINSELLNAHSAIHAKDITLKELQKFRRQESGGNTKITAGKLHHPGSKTKRLHKQLKKTRELVESAHKSSNLVFTLLGEPSQENRMARGLQRPSSVDPSSPPTCLPPPPPPQPSIPAPPPASFSPIIDSQYPKYNANLGEVQQGQYLMRYPGNVVAHPPNNSGYIYSNPVLGSQRDTLRASWLAHNQSMLFQRFPSYEQPSNIGPPTVQPTSVNNRMSYLPNEQELIAEGSTKYRHPSSQTDSVVNVKRTQTLAPASRQKTKAKASMSHRKKKKAPKSLKRIDGMVRKYDLGDNL